MFFFSLLFCQFLIRNYLKATEIVIHSLIQRISMQIWLEMNAKKHKSHQKTISPLCTLFRFRSEFSYRNYDDHKDLRTLSSMIAINIFQQNLVFLSSLCVDKDLTINIH